MTELTSQDQAQSIERPTVAQTVSSNDEEHHQHKFFAIDKRLFDDIEAKKSHRRNETDCTVTSILDDRSDIANNDNIQIFENNTHFNHPHPVLEFPILYLLIQNVPFLLLCVQWIYELRWKLSYRLQHKLAGTYYLRKVGIYFSYGELLLLLPFTILVGAGLWYTILHPSIKITGIISRYGVIGALLFAQRNSVITLLLGISIDRMIFYHKTSGYVASLTGVMHGISYFLDKEVQRMQKGNFMLGAFNGYINTSGSVLLMLMVAMVISSLPSIRRRIFEIFYFLHIMFLLGMVCCTFYHSGILIPTLAASIWGVDIFIRYIVMARFLNPRKAHFQLINDTVLEVIFTKSRYFNFNPGQYIYLCVPEVSQLQWHPFSIASAPTEEITTLYIRKAGNWTSSLFDLAKSKEVITILIDGPYGSLGVDIMGDRKYKNIMLISGGIGVTPMQSICNQLLCEASNGSRTISRIKFIWIQRDPFVVSGLTNTEGDGECILPESYNNCNMNEYEVEDHHVSSVLASFPSSYFTESEFEELFQKQHDLFDEMFRSNSSFETPIMEELQHRHNILDKEIYVTGNFNNDGDYGMKNVRCGRPDTQQLFDEMKRDVLQRGENRVAVCVCAPPKVISLCQKACILFSDKNIRFDIHYETMSTSC